MSIINAMALEYSTAFLTERCNLAYPEEAHRSQTLSERLKKVYVARISLQNVYHSDFYQRTGRESPSYIETIQIEFNDSSSQIVDDIIYLFISCNGGELLRCNRQRGVLKPITYKWLKNL